MELLPYQQQVLDDLASFLGELEHYGNAKKAFNEYWLKQGVAKPELYRQSIAKVPQVCMKVPTGGGKTFIAACAMKTVFDALSIYMRNEPQAVVWLVPSNSILEQTVKNLKNSQHPYRRKVDTLFNGRVAVYTKEDLLQGASFNASTVREQLNVFVLSYASFRTSNKEGRKAYQENSNLATFAHQMNDDVILADTDESALINVIRSMKPLCIVDESHNASSKLSKEMLENFNPSLVIDLTATPRKDSNIISYVDAAQLKTYNMVKLPVIVYNHHSSKEVISNAIQLRNNLELQAVAEQKVGGDYIRPIVLFQAETKAKKEDKGTFEDIKKRLITLGIPEEEVAIKTANINELKGEELLSPDCKIRYIITINALKEGWDCPFAYILATIANRNSLVDVEQIVGRVLRQPYARKHHNNLLNNSYVLASSGSFLKTLDNIVEGLNQAGFSKRDLRAEEVNGNEAVPGSQDNKPTQPSLFGTESVSGKSDNSTEQNNILDIEWPEKLPTEGSTEGEDVSSGVDKLIEHANQVSSEYEKEASEKSRDNIADEVKQKMNYFSMVSKYRDEASALRLAQFHIQITGMSLFEDTFFFEKNELLKEFQLGQADSHIDFTTLEDEAYRVDIEEVGKGDYKPSFWKLQHSTKERLMEFLIALPEESKKREVTNRLCDLIGNMYPIADQEVKRYVRRILDNMNTREIHDCIEREYSYRDKIKAKIRELATSHAETVFYQWLAADRIQVKGSYEFPEHIHPVETAPSIPSSLYESEGKLNSWEAKVINEVANLENVLFWHRIVERKGFVINGFINHYPDFLVQTRSGKSLIIETKGDDRDNSDSIRKLKLGEAWANKAGNDYRYFMVFDNNAVERAYNLNDFLAVVKNL
jgi:type III restriction enzyme